MERILKLDADVCTGCRTCELVCSVSHFKRSSPTLSAIRIVQDPVRSIDVPVICQQCETPACLEVCPVRAIHKDEKTGVVLVNEDSCVGCKLCIWACPCAGITMGPGGKLLKCDLCEGDPWCVKFCPVKAVDFVEVSKLDMKMKRIEMKKMIEAAAAGRRTA